MRKRLNFFCDILQVERYLTHLNNREKDEGIYGSSDLSFNHIRPSSVNSQQVYQDTLKRFEQLYTLAEYQQHVDLDISAFTSDSLYV